MKGYNIHNVRFYDFQPEAIHCLAYNDHKKLLALSRADGTIELWNCQKKPFKQDTLIGQSGSSVESLSWCDDRLFSAGLNGFIIEYSIPGFVQKAQVAVTGGPTWCLSLSPNKMFLAAGSEEGYLNIFQVTKDLVYDKTLTKQKNRILSVGWHSDSDHIVTGSVNLVQLISLKTGQTLQFPISKDSGLKETIVWCVALLDDMTIVTGDSRGFTCFWDGLYGTSISVIQSHQADVLTMQVKPNCESVYVAGVDPIIVEVRFVHSGEKHSRPRMWVKSVQRNIHSHDVRALAITSEGKLFSGGVDTYLALSYYPPKTAIKYPATPPKGYMSLAKFSRTILLGYKRKIELWKLGVSIPELQTIDRFLSIAEDHQKLLELELKADDRLEYCSLSPRGQRIAYIVQGKVKIYKYTFPQEIEGGHLEKVKCNSEVLPSRLLHWFDEDTVLSATQASNLQVLTLDEEVSVRIATSQSEGGGIQDIASSDHGSFFALLEYNNFATVYTLEKQTLTHLITLRSQIPVTALALNCDNVFLTYSHMKVAEINIHTGESSSFSKMINNALSESKMNNVFQKISFDNPDYVFLHSISSLYILRKKIETSSEPPTKIMKYNQDAESNDSCNPVQTLCEGLISTVRRSNHIFYFSHISDTDLISIEINPIWLMDSLPPSLKEKKFGAS